MTVRSLGILFAPVLFGDAASGLVSVQEIQSSMQQQGDVVCGLIDHVNVLFPDEDNRWGEREAQAKAEKDLKGLTIELQESVVDDGEFEFEEEVLTTNRFFGRPLAEVRAIAVISAITPAL